MATEASSSLVESQAQAPDSEIQQVQLLDAEEDNFDGVIVKMPEQPMDGELYTIRLRASISTWRQRGKKGVWIELPLALSNLVDPTVKEGFRYHHAEKDYLMLVNWLPEASSTPSTIPANASHRVGIGAFVMNDKKEVLVVQEISGKFRGIDVWKLPTGVVDEGEDICKAAIREVKEETGVDCKFVEILALRQSHKSYFTKSDLFFVCMLQPCSYDTVMEKTEIKALQWMPIQEYAAQSFVQKNDQFKFIADILIAKSKENYPGFVAKPYKKRSGETSYLYCRDHIW